MKKVEQYPRTVRVLHWLTAGAIAIQIVLGFLMEDLGKSVVLVHAALGSAILLLTAFRVLTVLNNKGALPQKPEDLSEKEWSMAKIGHGVLYACLLAVPATGLAGFFSGEHDLLEIHETLVWIFIVLIVGHIGFTIKHQFFDKKKILQRMT